MARSSDAGRSAILVRLSQAPSGQGQTLPYQTACRSPSRLSAAGVLVAEREPHTHRSFVGVDSRLNAIHLSQHMAVLTQHQNLTFLQLDLLSPQFVEEVGTFDSVTAIHLLEHLPEAQLPLAFQHLLQVTRHRLVVAVPYETEATRAYGQEQVFTRETLEHWGRWCVESLDGAGRFWCEDVAGGLLIIDRTTD